MATLEDISVDYEILRAPPPTISSGPGGGQGRMIFMVALADVPAFTATICGTTEVIDLGGGATMTRIVPLVHPDYPDLIAVGFGSEPFGTPGGTGTSVYAPMFSHSRITVDFETVPFGLSGDTPYYTVSTEFGGSYETIPGGAFRFADGSRPTGELGIYVPEIAWSVTTYMSPGPVSTAVRDVVGMLNNAVFLGCPIGTVRFDGVRSEFTKSMLNTTYVKTYSLKYRARPWNQVLKPTGNWDVPTDVATGLPKYASGNLNVILS